MGNNNSNPGQQGGKGNKDTRRKENIRNFINNEARPKPQAASNKNQRKKKKKGGEGISKLPASFNFDLQ